MKTFFSLMLIIATMAGCKKEAVNTDFEAVAINNQIELSVLDSNGEDLLDPQNVNGIKPSDIKVFYMVGDNRQEVYDPSKTYPRNFLIYQHEAGYRIRIFLNSAEGNSTPETHVEWNGSSDIIKAEYNISPATLTLDKVWLNDSSVWTRSDKKDLHFTLIK